MNKNSDSWFCGLFLLFLTLPVQAALQCEGTVYSQASGQMQRVKLEPMQQDKELLIGKLSRFSFVADTYEISNDKIRIFIHDLEQDHTSVTPATLQTEGTQKTASIKQIIGYESPGKTLTVELICTKD